MHEFSVMSDMVNVLLAEVESRKILKINEVVMEVGELAFLADEQLKFSYGVLVEKNAVLKDSVLMIKKIPATVDCQQCDYSGPIEYISSDDDHFRMPIIKCPECDGAVTITGGRECQIKNLVAEVDD